MNNQNVADDIEETEDDEEESTWENKFDWLIIPSLLTALAIIIAIIGFYVRKKRLSLSRGTGDFC